jgi:6-phosphogluconolactonase
MTARPQLTVVPPGALAEAARQRLRALQPRRLALAGGSTPRALYEALRADDLPWAEIDVFFGDERCVPPDHPDSNEGMARRALLDRVPVRVHAMGGASCDAAAYEAELAAVFGAGQPTAFDVALLGLGEDGHTASLFPGDAAVDEGERLVARVERPDHPRLTLTPAALSAARVALFLVAGESKREPLARWLAGEDLPASHVRAARVEVLADAAAADGLDGPDAAAGAEASA